MSTYATDPNGHEARTYEGPDRELLVMVSKDLANEGQIRLDGCLMAANPEQGEDLIDGSGWVLTQGEAIDLALHMLQAAGYSQLEEEIPDLRCRSKHQETMLRCAAVAGHLGQHANGYQSWGDEQAYAQRAGGWIPGEKWDKAVVCDQRTEDGRWPCTQRAGHEGPHLHDAAAGAQIARALLDQSEAAEIPRLDGTIIKVDLPMSEEEASQLRREWIAREPPINLTWTRAIPEQIPFSIQCTECGARAEAAQGTPFDTAFRSVPHASGCSHRLEGEGPNELQGHRTLDPSPQNFFARTYARCFRLARRFAGSREGVSG